MCVACALCTGFDNIQTGTEFFAADHRASHLCRSGSSDKRTHHLAPLLSLTPSHSQAGRACVSGHPELDSSPTLPFPTFIKMAAEKTQAKAGAAAAGKGVKKKTPAAAAAAAPLDPFGEPAKRKRAAMEPTKKPVKDDVKPVKQAKKSADADAATAAAAAAAAAKAKAVAAAFAAAESDDGEGDEDSSDSDSEEEGGPEEASGGGEHKSDSSDSETSSSDASYSEKSERGEGDEGGDTGADMDAENAPGAEAAEAAADPLAISNFNISAQVARQLTSKGITSLFGIQAETFQTAMDGKDIVARAKTGCGGAG